MYDINKIIKDYEHLKNKSNSSYLSKLHDMERILEEESKKLKSRKIKIISSILFLAIIIIFISIKNYNETREKEKIEQLRLEKLEQRKIEQERIDRERKISEELIRKEKNINRVKNSIFINQLIEDFKKEQATTLKSEITKTNKENEYVTFFKNNLINFEKETKSKIKTICKNEASKDVDAVPYCIENNNNKLQEFLTQENTNISDSIKKVINDLEIFNRNKRLDTFIVELNADLNKNKELIKNSKMKFDDYMINGKNIPTDLRIKIDNLEYKINNITHKINYYENAKKSSNLNIVEPENLKKPNITYKTEKKFKTPNEIIQTPEINEQIKKTTLKINDVSKQIKIIQEKIDDAFINGEKPNPVLIKELEELKKLQ